MSMIDSPQVVVESESKMKGHRNVDTMYLRGIYLVTFMIVGGIVGYYIGHDLVMPPPPHYHAATLIMSNDTYADADTTPLTTIDLGCMPCSPYTGAEQHNWDSCKSFMVTMLRAYNECSCCQDRRFRSCTDTDIGLSDLYCKDNYMLVIG